MIANIRELLSARDLLYMWSWREIRTRYKQSMLGMGWAIVQPLAMTIVYVVVFTAIVRVPSDGIPYPLFAYTALLPWTFLASAISTGVPSLVANMGLVTKIYFPREVLPLAAVIGRLFDFMWASVVLLGLLLIYQVPITPAIVWLPLLLALQVLLTIGVVLLGAALNVAYRDVGQLIPLLTQIWMYASPVIYPVSLVPDRFRVLYYLNPMAGIIDGYRSALLLGKAPDGAGLLLSAAMSIGAVLAGYAYFKKVEITFADII